jgi:hypothetical protein
MSALIGFLPKGFSPCHLRRIWGNEHNPQLLLEVQKEVVASSRIMF